ncbi:hypothetical protein LCGC14_1185760 [marine sediment metagenome]|uniref:Uncharacterized protein n=1 Tax=marine sediment metagenome TaxID=412755 RepID=A0A0F9LQN3_9ZZZZ
MTDSLSFNINCKVRLRLTPHGVSVLKTYHNKIMEGLPNKLKREFELELNEAGVWEEQLWVVMHKLGPAICNGGKAVIKSNEITILYNRE